MSVWLSRGRPQQSKPAIALLLALAFALFLSSSALPAPGATETGSRAKPIRLLLLAASGAGKTTFLNLLLWYAEVSKLSHPTQAEIDSIRQRHNKENENPDNPHSAQTKSVQAYKVMLKDMWFEILDVPGFNDNTGENQDTENSKMIVDSVRKGSYLNAILLVLKGRQTRVTPGLGKVLEGIRPFLPSSLSANTMLIFTRVKHETDLNFPFHLLENGLSGAPRLLLDNPFSKFACGDLDDEELQVVLDDAVELLPGLDDLFVKLKAFVPISITYLDAMELNRAYKESPMRIVLAGPSGAGKTLFCEFLRLSLRGSGVEDPTQASAEFLRSHHFGHGQNSSFLSDTQNVTKYTETLSGGGSVEIYDTPGLLDTAGPARDIEHLGDIDGELRSLDYVDAVLLVFHGDDQGRSDDQMKKVLAQLSAIFQPAVYPNIALVFSHLDNSPKLPPMMIDPYLKAKFNFSSEDKSRRFCLDNPLNSLAKLFDANAERETIASVLQRGSRIHRKRYNDGVQELSRLLRYFASGKSVSRCTNPDFGSFYVSKGLLKYLAQVLVQEENGEDEDSLPTNSAVPTLDLELACDKAYVDATIASRGRKILKTTHDVAYNLNSLLPSLAAGGSVAEFAKLLSSFHFGVTLWMVAGDFLKSDQDQEMMQERTEQFELINEELDYLVDRIQKVFDEEHKKAIFQGVKTHSDTILKLADRLLTCRGETESKSMVNDLIAECSTFDLCASQEIIRLHHVPDSVQDSILRRANYDPRMTEDVRLALALMLTNLHRAADISRLVRSMFTDGAHSRSLLRTSAQDDMIADAQSILNEFHAGMRFKLRTWWLTKPLSEDMRSILRNHASTDDALGPLYQIVMEKYHPLFSGDLFEFYVAVYNEYASGGAPPAHQQLLRWSPREIPGSPCAVQVERVNGKCAVVMWNTHKPKLTAQRFIEEFKNHQYSVSKQVAGPLAATASALRSEYASFHLVRVGYDWRGRASDNERFVSDSLFKPYPWATDGWFRGADPYHLVIG